MRENKLNLIKTINYPDHYNFTKKDLDSLIYEAKIHDSILITTEKDYYRIEDNYKKNIELVKVELEINNKNDFIELIKEKI